MVKLPMLVGWSDPAHIGSRMSAAVTSTRTIFMNQCIAVVVEALLLLPSTVLYIYIYIYIYIYAHVANNLPLEREFYSGLTFWPPVEA